MKKFLLVFVFGLAILTSASAQNTFKKGDRVINAGIGLGSTLHSGGGYSTTIPPITGSFEQGIISNLFDSKSSLGVGGYIGYASSEYSYGLYNYKYKYSDFVLGARGAVHYQFIDKLDTYVGLSLGYKIISVSSSGSNYDYPASASGIGFGTFLGARYYFNEKFAVMAELGYDIAVLKIGIAFKI